MYTSNQATTWVKRESEKVAREVEANPSSYKFPAAPDLKSCFLEYADGSAKYDTKCIDDVVGEYQKKEKQNAKKGEKTVEVGVNGEL
jgi:hypothetical protein